MELARGALPACLTFHDAELLRLGGDGYVGPISWASDDLQFVTALDGVGWSHGQTPTLQNTKLAVLEGVPPSVRIANLEGYPSPDPARGLLGKDPFFYITGMVVVGSRIYQCLSSFDRDYSTPANSPWALSSSSYSLHDIRYSSVKLIYSDDGGQTWSNQNGTRPVHWEMRAGRTTDRMMFADEPDGAFSQIAFAQMGAAYELNQDAYVYGFGPDGYGGPRAGRIAMFRAPSKYLTDRHAYEYFAGFAANSEPRWSIRIDERTSIVTLPDLRSGLELHWGQPTVVYNKGLNQYMMVASGTRDLPSLTEDAGLPNALGFWTSPNPWGPWSLAHLEEAWLPGADPASRPLMPQIPPMWVSEDGASFWLVWTDFQTTRGFGQGMATSDLYDFTTVDGAYAQRRRWAHFHPYTNFNAQRVGISGNV